MSSKEASTPAPQPPPDGPTDWPFTVHGNSFSNAQRLALWTGGTTPIASFVDPSRYFLELGRGALGAAVKGVVPAIYVVVHGWAPGYRKVVDAEKGNLLWWGSKASLEGRWLADWAWAPVGPHSSVPDFTVNPTGILQQIMRQDPSAAALLYSWIDGAATAAEKNSIDVSRSEANTQVNGIRLADALQEVIAPEFFEQGGQLRLIGHSHGSKVCTVAAFTLQQRKVRVAHLTIMDSPESGFPLSTNGANLLAFYLEQMDIRNPTDDGAAGALVESYASYFGVGYKSAEDRSPLDNIVEIALKPSEIYSGFKNAGDYHIYAAGWYGGAAAGAEEYRRPPLGLAWPPVQKPYDPALNQTWPGGRTQANQWLLNAGTSIIGSRKYALKPLLVTTRSRSGKVTGDPSTGLVFTPASPGGNDFSIFLGSFPNNKGQYGFAFDVEWSSPQAGDYFVVAAGASKDLRALMVIDGQSAPIGKTSVAINSTLNLKRTIDLGIYFLGSSNFVEDHVRISNFRWIQVTQPDGSAILELAPEVQLIGVDVKSFAG